MSKIDKIIVALKNARKAQGLSQSELSERVGVPQSHISKIENGNVDIQLSSLTQIARALDFELQLVPKKALPAVQSIIRSSEPRRQLHQEQLSLWNNIIHADELELSKLKKAAIKDHYKDTLKKYPLLYIKRHAAYALDEEDE